MKKMNLEGTEFQIKVWNELKKIPIGETKTYKEIFVFRACECHRRIG